jgi:hypothetical protein
MEQDCEDRDGDSHRSTDRGRKVDSHCSTDSGCKDKTQISTYQDHEVNSHSRDGSFQLSINRDRECVQRCTTDQDHESQDREVVEDEYNGFFLYLDLLADTDWGRGLLCDDHPASENRLSMKIPSAVNTKKKLKSVEWIQDRLKEEIDVTRMITNADAESEVADLLQERSSCQSDGIGVKDGDLQEEHTRLVKGLEMNATVRMSKKNEDAKPPAQTEVEFDQALIVSKRSICETSPAKDGDPDETDTVHRQSSRQSDGMSIRDCVSHRRDTRRSGDEAIARTYEKSPGVIDDMLSQPVINSTKDMSSDVVAPDRFAKLKIEVGAKVIDRGNPRDVDLGRKQYSHLHGDEIATKNYGEHGQSQVVIEETDTVEIDRNNANRESLEISRGMQLGFYLDRDRGRGLFCGDHPASEDRILRKVPLFINTTKKNNSVYRMQDRPKEEIDTAREITNVDNESEKADLSQEWSSCQSDGFMEKDGELQEEPDRQAKRLEVKTIARVSDEIEGVWSPSQAKMKIDQASNASRFKRAICEFRATMDDNLDEADPVHGQSSRPSDKMSTRDDVLRGRNARQTGDAAMTRNYVELPGTKFGVSSQATIGDIKTYGDKVVHDRPTSLTTKVKKVIDRDDPHDSEFDRDRLSHHHKDEIKMGDSEGHAQSKVVVKETDSLWFYLDRGKDGYARNLAHMWHGPFREADEWNDHAVRSGQNPHLGRAHCQCLVYGKGYSDLSSRETQI